MYYVDWLQNYIHHNLWFISNVTRMDICVLRCNDGSSAPPGPAHLLAPCVAIRMLSPHHSLTHFSVLAASSPQSVGKSEIITVKFVCWLRKMKNLWSFGLSDIPIIFKGDFHLKIYLNVGDQRTRMGWEAPQPTPDSSSTQLLHHALAGLELDHQPPTQELINEGWNTKSIFTLCFVVRSIIEPYQFEMLLAWGCWGHRTAANSNSVYSFCGLGMHSHSEHWCESLICCLLVSITTTVYAFVSFVKSGTRIFITALVSCF